MLLASEVIKMLNKCSKYLKIQREYLWSSIYIF